MVHDKLRNQLYERDGHSCHYCGIPESEFIATWGSVYDGVRGHTLEVDRKDNNGKHTLNNCVLACAICNVAKSDKFTYNEFKVVGESIKSIWPHHQPT